MRIELIEYQPTEGAVSQLVSVSVSDHNDAFTARDIVAVSAFALGGIRFSIQKWVSAEDVCYEIRRSGGAKALDKVVKALTSMGMGYEKQIVRSIGAPREVR